MMPTPATKACGVSPERKLLRLTGFNSSPRASSCCVVDGRMATPAIWTPCGPLHERLMSPVGLSKRMVIPTAAAVWHESDA